MKIGNTLLRSFWELIVSETLQVDREIRHGINYEKAVAQGIILTDERGLG